MNVNQSNLSFFKYNKSRRIICCFIYTVICLILIFITKNIQINDAKTYNALAKEIVLLDEFYPHKSNIQDFYIRPSLYINFVGLVYRIFGIKEIIIKVINVLFSLIQFICIEYIVYALQGRNTKKLWLSILLFPTLYFINLLILTEPLFLTLLMISWAIYIKIIVNNEDKPVYFIVSGIFIAIAILTRPVALLIPAFTTVGFIIKKRRKINISLYLSTMILLIWAYGFSHMNKIGRIDFYGTTAGFNLFREYNPYGTGRRSQNAIDYVLSFDTSNLNAFERNQFYIEKAQGWIKNNFGKAVVVTFKKAVYMFIYDGIFIERALNKKNEIDIVNIYTLISKFKKGYVSWIIVMNQIIYTFIIIQICRGIINLYNAKEYEKLFMLMSIPVLLFIVSLSASGNNRFHYVILMTSYPLLNWSWRTNK